MEISGVSSKAYTSIAQGVDEEEKVEEEQEEQSTQKAKEYGVSAKEKEDKDVTEFSSSDYGESDVEEKAQNYLKNILFVGNLTEESQTAIARYMNTFDVSKFIKSYGPFSSTAEISAAMYAATAGLIKHPQNE